MSTTDVTISSEDIAALADIGHDTLKSIVALVVEAILYSKCVDFVSINAQLTVAPFAVIYFVLVVIAGRIMMSVLSLVDSNMTY